jgi:DNA-binding HxlR family transcriptional regulator
VNPAQPFPTEIELTPPEALKRCPIDTTFRIIGKKFTVSVLRNMIYSRQKHFNEFLHSIDEINPNTLSTRLREMEKNRIIERKVFDETPVRIEYLLTDKGKDLLPILDQMAAFSMKHAPEIFKNNKTSSFQEVTGRNPVSF